VVDSEAWADVFREAPIGVLVLGFLLLVVGGGLIVGGAVFALAGGARSWPVWVVLFGAGPLAIYLALNFVYRRSWAWSAVIAMLVLTALTSTYRAFSADVFPAVPILEIVISLGTITYLVRPHVRRAFDR
jgi:hypothetical protein